MQGSGMASHLPPTGNTAPTPSAPPSHVETARSEAEAENQGHKTQSTLEGPPSVYLEKRACPSSHSAGLWALTWQIKTLDNPTGEGRVTWFCQNMAHKRSRWTFTNPLCQASWAFALAPSCFSQPEQQLTFWLKDVQVKLDFNEQAWAKPFLTRPLAEPRAREAPGPHHTRGPPWLCPSRAAGLPGTAEPSPQLPAPFFPHEECMQMSTPAGQTQHALPSLQELWHAPHLDMELWKQRELGCSPGSSWTTHSRSLALSILI